MTVPTLWWSDEHGVIERAMVDGQYRLHGVGDPVPLPDDAVPLVPAEPVDEKGRGPSYLRGFTDGRMAERAAAAAEENECQCSPRSDGLHMDWCPANWAPVPVSADRLEPRRAAPRLDPPPFAPELADAPMVTGESGTPAPLVVDHPVHESALPEELVERQHRCMAVCRDCGPPVLPVPFGTVRERDEWVDAHGTTGHTVVRIDGWPSRSQVQAILDDGGSEA